MILVLVFFVTAMIVFIGGAFFGWEEKQPKVVGKKRTEDLEYTSIFKSNSNGK